MNANEILASASKQGSDAFCAAVTDTKSAVRYPAKENET